MGGGSFARLGDDIVLRAGLRGNSLIEVLASAQTRELVGILERELESTVY